MTTNCPICCKPVSMPFRYVSPDGEYREGCVHECHDPYISSQEVDHAKAVRAKIKKASRLRRDK